jgi:hypothetical protein
LRVTFLQQQGLDPFAGTPERTAQIRDVATRLAHFIGEAKSTIDIAIYDFRLRDEAATIVADGLRSQARKGVRTRIAYDSATNPDADAIPTAAPSQIESDQRPIGIDTFVRSFADVAQVKGITGYRVLMHITSSVTTSGSVGDPRGVFFVFDDVTVLAAGRCCRTARTSIINLAWLVRVSQFPLRPESDRNVLTHYSSRQYRSGPSGLSGYRHEVIVMCPQLL